MFIIECKYSRKNINCDVTDLAQEIIKILNLKTDQFINPDFDNLEELYFNEGNLHTLIDRARLKVVKNKVTNSDIMEDDITKSEKQCQERINLNTNLLEQSFSNGRENQSTFEKAENILRS